MYSAKDLDNWFNDLNKFVIVAILAIFGIGLAVGLAVGGTAHELSKTQQGEQASENRID